MPYVTVRDVRYHLVDVPAREPDPAAEPVVMLHGLFTGSAASWYRTAVRTIAAHRPVRLVDWRGHGRSERPASGYGARSLALDLSALTADLPPFGIVSHSYGGLAALRFMLAEPERVRRAVLVEPPLDAAGPGGSPEERARATLAAADPTVAGDSPLAATDPALRWLIGHLPAGAASKLEDLVTRTSIRADLAAEPHLTDAELAGLPQVPLLVVSGTESPFGPAAARLAGLLPDARGMTLPGGHDLHVTHYQEIAALLVDFFDGAPAGLPAPSVAHFRPL
jgi:pimeloyl-ACP methyl ester carboxylesterase